MTGQRQEHAQTPLAASASPQPDSELAALREEVNWLKRLVPSQSHAMQDVSYHYTNLWFAGRKARKATTFTARICPRPRMRTLR